MAALVLPLTRPAPAAAVQTDDATLSGRVVLGLTDEPAGGAEVRLLRSGRRTLTGESGGFLVEDVLPGEETVVVHYLGLSSMEVPVRILAGRTTTVELAIVAPMYQMKELLVEVRGVSAIKMVGFERRRRHGTGYFLTRQEIAERRPLHTSDLIDGMRGARVVTDIDGRRRILVRAGGSHCSPELYIDGQLLKEIWIDDLLPEHLEALEFYPRWWDRPVAYRTPLRYDSLPGIASPSGIGQEGCGAILVWTRESLPRR